MFPEIKSLDDLLPHIEDNPQIRVKTEDNGMTVVCYMLQDEDTFSGTAEEYARECRGITFAPDRKIAARCLTKFFNIGEREDTQPHNIDWSRVVRIMDKRDGCLDGDTVLLTPDGEMTIREIVETQYRGLVLGVQDGQMIATPVLGHQVLNDPEKEWFELTLENGTILRLTGNHKVFSVARQEYVRVDELLSNEELLLIEELAPL